MKSPEEFPLIITTRITDDAEKAFAKKAGYKLVDIPMIRIRKRMNANRCTQISDVLKNNPDAAIAITSRNAVESLFLCDSALTDIRKRRTYAVGQKTAELLAENNFEHIFTADGNAESLGKLIHEHSETAVIHFCGNRRRDELGDQLQENDISYHDEVVYETILQRTIPKNLPGNADFIFFMSPSSVQAFFTLGLHHVYDESVYIAIGRTTLQDLMPRNVTTRVAREPSFESMIKECR